VGYKDVHQVARSLRASPYEDDEALLARIGAELVGRRWLVRETELEARGYLFQTSRLPAIDEAELLTVPDDLIGRGTPAPRLRDVQFGSGPAVARGTVIIEVDGRYFPMATADELPAVIGVLWQPIPESAGLRDARGKVAGQILALEERLDVLAPQAGQAKADAEAGDLVGRLRLLERKRDQLGARLAALEAERTEAARAAEHDARLATIQDLAGVVSSLTAQRREIGRLAGQLAEVLKAEAVTCERVLTVGQQVGMWDAEREAQGQSPAFYAAYCEVAPDSAVRRGDFDPGAFRLEALDGTLLWPAG